MRLIRSYRITTGWKSFKRIQGGNDMLGNISLGPDLSEFVASIAYDFIGGKEPEVNGSEP